MRLFIGIFLPEEILDYLYEVENKLKQSLPAKINWVAKKNVHLTLKFLGLVDDKKVNEIINELKKVNFENFELELDDFGEGELKEELYEYKY